MTRRWILLLYVLPALLLLAGSLPFLLGDFDLRIAQNYYNESAHLWTYAGKSPWAQLYKFGPVPAILTAVAAFSAAEICTCRPFVVFAIASLSFFTARFLYFPEVLSWDCFPGESIEDIAPVFRSPCACTEPLPYAEWSAPQLCASNGCAALAGATRQ